MYSTTNKTLTVTRGDNAYFTINFSKALAEGDTITFTVKKNSTDTTFLFQKTLDNGITSEIGSKTATLKILPADTSSLEFGKYKYDVQVNRVDTGVATVITPNYFIIGEEVTY